jgi:hypothetical protein
MVRLNCVILLLVILVLAQQTHVQDPELALFGKTWTLTEMEGRKFSADKPNLEFDRDFRTDFRSHSLFC